MDPAESVCQGVRLLSAYSEAAVNGLLRLKTEVRRVVNQSGIVSGKTKKLQNRSDFGAFC